MLTREEFLTRRRSGIGGSDIAAIVGLSPRRSPLDVYFDKIGETSEPEEPTPTKRAPLYWGTVLEEPIARAYAAETGRRVVRYTRLLRSPERPWEIGDIDRLVIDDGAKIAAKPKGEIVCRRGLECKTARMHSEEWGEPGTDEIPVQYFAQVQWYMGLAPSIEEFDVAVLFGGSDFAIYTVTRNDSIIAKLRESGGRFWRCVEDRIPPAPRSLDDVQKLRPEPVLPSMTASLMLETDLRALAEATAKRKAAEVAEGKWKDRVAVQIADAEIVTDPAGEVLATFKKAKTGGRRLTVKVK